jgi:hypothetical protein
VNGKVYSQNTKELSNIEIASVDNCNVLSVENINIIELNNQILLTFYISIIPDDENKNAFVEFKLPEKELIFKSKKDVICHFSGYSEEDELNNIYNIIGISKASSKNVIIRFQPNSLEVHNIAVWCRYSM